MSNIHLKGDINYDGYINMVDYNMVKSQLGNDRSLPWGFNTNEYNPDADINKNGVIDEYDLAYVEQKIGFVHCLYCPHPNPSMIGRENDDRPMWKRYNCWEWGWGQYLNTNAEDADEEHKQGFHQGIHVGITGIGWTVAYAYPRYPLGLWDTGVEASGGIIDEILPFDKPLKSFHEFIIEEKVTRWEPSSPEPYLACGFGGWIITREPYVMDCLVNGNYPFVPIPQRNYHQTVVSNIIEIMFFSKYNFHGSSPAPGGDDWHFIICRPGPGMVVENSWFIFQYVYDDLPLNEWKTNWISNELFSRLVSKIQPGVKTTGPQTVTGNPLIIEAEIKSINLTNAVLRVPYVNLEGYNCRADRYVTKMYWYTRKSQLVWAPALSPIAEVEVSH